MRESDGSAVSACGPGVAPSDGVDQSVWSREIAGVITRRPCSPRVDAGMIVGSSDERLEPRCVSFWSDTVFRREALHDSRIQGGQKVARQVIDCSGPGAILYLEGVAQQNRLFDVLERQ